jgi:hypothetical protein
MEQGLPLFIIKKLTKFIDSAPANPRGGHYQTLSSAIFSDFI